MISLNATEPTGLLDFTSLTLSGSEQAEIFKRNIPEINQRIIRINPVFIIVMIL